MDEGKTKIKGQRRKEVFDAALFNVTHIFSLARDKVRNREYEECLKLLEMATKIGKENVVNLDLMADVLTAKRMIIITLAMHDKEYPIPQLLALAEDFYNLKGKDRDQYARCFEQLRKPIFDVALTPGSKLHQQKLILQSGSWDQIKIKIKIKIRLLQGRALRRFFEVDEDFDEKPWQKYTEETKKDFIDFIAFRITFSPLIDQHADVIFMMMDVNGVGMVNIWDAQQMIRDMDTIIPKRTYYSGPDGLAHAIYDLLVCDCTDCKPREGA